MKFNVLVAEDEMPILRSICSTIMECSDDFEIVAKVYNGSQAIKELDLQSIDLAFLDINMPVKSGIDVLQYIQQKHPQTIAVILSGYQEFEYAQKALKFGAFDFLLKPLKNSEMSAILSKVSAVLYKQYETKILSMLQITKNGMEDIPLKWDMPSYIAVVYFGSFHLCQSEMPLTEETFSSEKAFRNTLNNIYGEHNYIMVSTNHYAAQLLMTLDNRQNPWSDLKAAFNNFNFGNQPITVIANQKLVESSDVIKTYHKLRNEAHKRMLYEKSSIYIIDDNSTSEPLYAYKDYFNSLSNKSKEEMINQYNKILFSEQLPTRINILKMTKEFFGKLTRCSDCITSYFDIEEDILRIVEENHDRNNLTIEVKKLLIGSMNPIVQQVNDKVKLAVEMKDFLDSNISKDISLVTIEKKFGYVSAYLRSIFRSQFKVSPLDYLLNVRIDRAKELLTQGAHVKDVARSVGFSDPFYFSKVFKKKTGYSPTLYGKD